MALVYYCSVPFFLILSELHYWVSATRQASHALSPKKMSKVTER